MTKIYPKPPSDQWAQFSDRQIFEKGGKKYSIQTEIIKHGTLWKIWQGSQAAFITLITLGIGFAFGLKGKWEKAVTGKEEVHSINRYPPPSQASTTDKTEALSQSIKPPLLDKTANQKLMVLEFINQFEENSSAFSMHKLEKEFQRALSISAEITTPDDIATLLNVADKIAKDYEEKGKVNKASELRLKSRQDLFLQKGDQVRALVATLIFPNIVNDVRNFLKKIRSEQLNAMTHQELITGLQMAMDIGFLLADPEDKTTLLTVAEKVAQEYVDKNDFKSAMKIRIQMVQAIKPSPPFGEIPTKAQNEDPTFGFRIHPIDTSLFKNHALAVQRQKFENGETRLHLEAKLTHPSRAALQKSVDFIQNNPDQLQKALPAGFCNKVTVTTENVDFCGRKTSVQGDKFKGAFSTNVGSDGYNLYGATNTVIHFKGIGQIKIGSNPDYRTLYNRISVDLDPHISADEAVSKLNIMFAALGLGAVASSSRPEDQERIKIMRLFRAYYPKEAYNFEREELSYTESIDSLKARIGNAVPEMKDKFKHYLEDHPDMMYLQEVYPGQPVWAIKGLAEEVKKAGGIGLMAGISGYDFDDAASRLVSILTSGSLSTLDRHQHGIIAQGASADIDYVSGGAESVFSRLFTSNMKPITGLYPLHGEFQILYDLALVERGGFCYPDDKYGTKEPATYQNRPSIVKLAHDIQKGDPEDFLSNEIVVYKRIAPRFMKALLVKTQEKKDKLVKTLRDKGLITVNDKMEECINGIPIDQFIHIGDEFKKEYWA